MRSREFAFLFLSAWTAMAAPTATSDVAGLWHGTITVSGQEIPFRIEFTARDGSLQGWFFNGDERVTSTSGRVVGESLSVEFAHYGTKLEAVLQDGHLKGTYGRAGRSPYAFRAVRGARTETPSGEVPAIAGEWEVAVQTAKGESAWRLLVNQRGADLAATILRVDGDTGTLTGGYRDGRFVLSHFSGARPAVLTLTPREQGELQVELSGRRTYTALRPSAARAKGLAGPTDPELHTSIRNPAEPFQFRFKDLNGQEVSASDERFAGKVLVVNITGSWCPNCHDEAPFLVELHQKYRAKGLEVIALSFEEAEQLQDPKRLRAFIQKYGIGYTVLLGGEPSELQAKLPQAVNLNSWPTTFFVGRDGRVRNVHAGFPGKASGPLHEEAKRHFLANVERLLAESTQSAQR
jgi:thiol-disulfide isomerase/thioredoxin